jgi:hypothetical protein
VNFHAKRYKGSGAKLTIAVKNMWAVGWAKAWFYCKVSMHALHSHMSALEFLMEPPVNYRDSDIGDVVFIKVTIAIGGSDAVEEYLACGLYLLSVDVNFEEVADGITPALKLKVPLPKFCNVHSDEEDGVKFLRWLNWRQRMLSVATATQSMRPASSVCRMEVG